MSENWTDEYKERVFGNPAKGGVMADRLYEWKMAMRALMFMRYNHSANEVMRMAYENFDAAAHEYKEEKMKRWDRCPLLFVANLDEDNLRRFIQALYERYGKE